MSKSITVNMSQGTAQALNSGKFTLYAFKGVQAFPNNGLPLAWFSIGHFNQSNTITWTEAYEAYSTNTSITAGSTISPLFNTAINIGQTLQIDSSGKGTVVNGQPGVISLTSTSVSLAGGVSQPAGNKASAICVFPVLGNTVQITPIDQLLLMMSNTNIKTGTIVTQTVGNSVVVDVTAGNSATVTFDINGGWSGGTTNVPAGSSTVPLLIKNQP